MSRSKQNATLIIGLAFLMNSCSSANAAGVVSGIKVVARALKPSPADDYLKARKLAESTRKAGENRILEDQSVVINLVETVKVVRPTHSLAKPLNLRVPKDQFAIEESLLGHPRSLYDDFRSQTALTVEKAKDGKELISMNSGQSRMLKWNTQGELKIAEVNTPNLKLSLENQGNGAVKLDYSETVRSNPHLASHNRTREIKSSRTAQLPKGTKLESYDLENGGKLRLHLKKEDGSPDVMEIAMDSAPATTPASGAHGLTSAQATK